MDRAVHPKIFPKYEVSLVMGIGLISPPAAVNCIQAKRRRAGQSPFVSISDRARRNGV
jgi:hypothetical protein